MLTIPITHVLAVLNITKNFVFKFLKSLLQNIFAKVNIHEKW